MHRWAACPGSVRLSAGIENTSSSYAEEGSDAHALGALCLRKNDAPGFHIGKTIKEDGRDFTVTEDMAEAVHVYVDYVAETFERGDKMHIEHKFDLSRVHPGCFGTGDCVIWKPKQQLLIVIDYKHGAGVPVEVVKAGDVNKQLQYYGLGALVQLGYPAKRVRLVVVQPRCEHPDGPVRSYEMDAIDLLDFRADLIAAAKATEAPDAPLVPGSHCRFCPAAALCPALVKMAQDVAKLEFAPSLSYDPAQLKLALDSREPLKAWLKSLDEFAYAEAEAGRTPPGYKLAAKRAARKWRSEGDVIDTLQDLGVKPEVFNAPPALKSPAQLEKVIDKAVLAPFIVSESSGHVLVPETDKRPTVTKDAKSDFTVVIPASTPVETAPVDDLLDLKQFARRKEMRN